MNAMTPQHLYRAALGQSDCTIRAQAREAVKACSLPAYPFVVDHAELLIRRGLGLEAVHRGLKWAFERHFVEEQA